MKIIQQLVNEAESDMKNYADLGGCYLPRPKACIVVSALMDNTLRNLHNSLYYSFKIFPYFWLVKATCITYHNQLLLTKFGKNFLILNRWRQNDVKSAAWLQVIEPLTEKTWVWGWVVFVVKNKMAELSAEHFHDEILS